MRGVLRPSTQQIFNILNTTARRVSIRADPGVGKTTANRHFAVLAAEQGLRVLVINETIGDALANLQYFSHEIVGRPNLLGKEHVVYHLGTGGNVRCMSFETYMRAEPDTIPTPDVLIVDVDILSLEDAIVIESFPFNKKLIVTCVKSVEYLALITDLYQNL